MINVQKFEDGRLNVISLYGFPRAGKDSLASFMYLTTPSNDDDSKNTIIGSFAQPIKKFVQELIAPVEYESAKDTPINSLSGMKINGKSKNEVYVRDIADAYGDAVRGALGDDIWVSQLYNQMVEHYNSCSGKITFVITDTRRLSEIKFLKELAKNGVNVVNVLILRKDSLPEWAKMGLSFSDNTVINNIIQKDLDYSPHTHEWCKSKNLKFQHVIYNDGTFEDLCTKAEEILNSLGTNNV